MKDSNDPVDEKCFGRCVKVDSRKYLKYTFKSRSDRDKCCVFGLIITCLLIAVILPSVIYQMVDATINEEVVIDGTDAPSYNAWRTNTEGDGAKVSVIIVVKYK